MCVYTFGIVIHDGQHKAANARSRKPTASAVWQLAKAKETNITLTVDTLTVDQTTDYDCCRSGSVKSTGIQSLTESTMALSEQKHAYFKSRCHSYDSMRVEQST